MATQEAELDRADGPSGSFSAVVQAGVLQSAFETVSVLVDEVGLHLEEDEWRMTAIDPATVGMVDVTVDAAAFESYDAAGETVGVDVGRVENVLGMVDGDELVRLDLDSSTRRLHVRVGGLEYALALIDPGAIREEPDLPDDLSVAGRVVLEGRDLARATGAADLVSDHVTLGTDDEGDPGTFLVTAEGDTDDVALEMAGEDLIDARITDQAEALYSLSYLAAMVRVLPADGPVTVEFGEDLPLTLQADVAEGVAVTYVLAPRIAR